jgi:hypothetical protein
MELGKAMLMNADEALDRSWSYVEQGDVFPGFRMALANYYVQVAIYKKLCEVESRLGVLGEKRGRSDQSASREIGDDDDAAR